MLFIIIVSTVPFRKNTHERNCIMKKTHLLRAIALALVLITALAAFAGCGDTPTGTTPSGGSTTTPPVTTSDNTDPPLTPTSGDISDSYEWGHLLMGCNGVVCGVAVHPADGDIVYAWSDVAGIYRFDPQKEEWNQLLDGLGLEYTSLQAVSGLALDPNDLDVVYAACGDYNVPGEPISDIIKSTDGGKTWSFMNFAEKVGLERVKCYNATMARAVGEPLVIDPNNSNIMYFGTMENGFYRSENKGESWTKITDIPDTSAVKGGVVNVYINPSKTQNGVSSEVYVSVWGHGLYKSDDGGLNFTLMQNSPIVPCEVQIVNKNGKEKMYVTSYNTSMLSGHEGLSKEEYSTLYLYENGTWRDLKPTGNSVDRNQLALSPILIDSRNPDIILVSSGAWSRAYGMWRSVDGGETFRQVSGAPCVSRLVQDPKNPDNVWVPHDRDVSYIKNFATYAPADKTDRSDLLWRGKGIEALCITKIASIPGTQDAPLALILAQDVGLKIQTELDEKSTEGYVSPIFYHGGGIDFCESNPNIVVRVGTYGTHDGGTGVIGYSTDSGFTYKALNWDSSMRMTDCAVSANLHPSGSPIIMVYSVGRSNDSPDGAGVYRSVDGGRSWQLMDLPNLGRYPATHYYNNRLLASDRVTPNVFYYIGSGNTIYRTMDGGNNWEKIRVSVDGERVRIAGRQSIKCVPGKAGHVWVKGEDGMILTSSDYGETWSILPGIEAIMSHSNSFGFGIGKDPAGDPAVYVLGYVDGELGCYLSDDMGKTWAKISPVTQKFLAGSVDVVGDRRVYGRVFIGTGGNGVRYGQIKP